MRRLLEPDVLVVDEGKTEIEAYALRYATAFVFGNADGTAVMSLDEDEVRVLIRFLERFAAEDRRDAQPF